MPIVTLAGVTMGTIWRASFACPSAADSARLHRSIDARLDALVHELSHWDPESALCHFNRAPAGRWIPLPPDFAQVIATGLAIAAESGGAFDPAIGRLVDLWGYGPPGAMPSPVAENIADARSLSGWHRLSFDPGARRLLQPGGLALDLSGIAKGHAVDVLGTLLHAAGVSDFLVEIGGELLGHGIRPDGDPWWVDLETPPGVVLTPLRIALHGLAVATSGRYVRGDHTLDPRTGHAITNGVLSASVLHVRTMDADAWATALTVLGPDRGMVLADHLKLAARIVTDDAGGVREWISPALAAMLAD